jgi:NAD-dependent oxidoreductase involved in siderophore biosynthesis
MLKSSSKRQVPSAIKSLLQRSLIEKTGEQFFLQPVVMKYVTQKLVEQVWQELTEVGGEGEQSKFSTPLFLLPY